MASHETVTAPAPAATRTGPACAVDDVVPPVATVPAGPATTGGAVEPGSPSVTRGSAAVCRLLAGATGGYPRGLARHLGVHGRPGSVLQAVGAIALVQFEEGIE